MNWNEKCLMELTHHNLFEDDAHRQRFRDLLNCYFTALFFSKSLCKCMYLFSWNDERFLMLLEMLNTMTLEGARDLRMMKDQNEIWEKQAVGYEAEIFRLTDSFLNGTEFEFEDFGVIDPEGVYMIRRGMQVSKYIDDLPELPAAGKLG